MKVEEDYFDILQNIELAIVSAYDRNPRLADRDVLAAVDALTQSYARERRGRGGQMPGPLGRARAVYEDCRRVCDWRLGRTPLNDDEPDEENPRPGEVSVSEVILCLKRVRKSVRLWHAKGGPRGYLDYIRLFLAEAADRMDA